MPLFLEPGQKYPIVLDSDMSKPEGERPTFFAQSQSMRGQQRIGEVLDLWTEQPDISLASLFDRTIEVLGDVIVGWSNMGGREFGADSMRDVINYNEARELLRKAMYNQHLTAEEKKSSESPL